MLVGFLVIIGVLLALAAVAIENTSGVGVLIKTVAILLFCWDAFILISILPTVTLPNGMRLW